MNEKVFDFFCETVHLPFLKKEKMKVVSIMSNCLLNSSNFPEYAFFFFLTVMGTIQNIAPFKYNQFRKEQFILKQL